MGLLALIPQKETAGINDQWERTGKRKYQAWFTQDYNAVNVRNNLGLTINTPHISDPGMVVVNISVDQLQDSDTFVNPTDPDDPNNNTAAYGWDVDIDYGPFDPLTHSATGSPIDQPVDVSFDWQQFPQPVDFAYDPNTGDLVAVVNSANDPFTPTIEREQLKGIMRVAWNSLTFNPVDFFNLGNCINADVWNGFPIGSVKFSPPKMPQRLFSQFLGQNYYRLEGEFCFNPNDKGWNAFPIDRGFRALDSGGKPFKIFDVNGQPISEPSLLDGSGNVLTDLTDYKQFNFQVYKSISFAESFPNLSHLFTQQ